MTVTRWEGKPTSGRYVYRGAITGDWFWQCDLHDEYEDGDGTDGSALTMPEALRAALAHAAECGLSNA